jgi:UrcA family protein
MCAKAAITTARLLLGATTIICTLFAGSVAAEDKMVTDSIRISPQGLDLTQPADAQTFYTRLENAAWIVCTRGTRVGMLPPTINSGAIRKRSERRSTPATSHWLRRSIWPLIRFRKLRPTGSSRPNWWRSNRHCPRTPAREYGGGWLSRRRTEQRQVFRVQVRQCTRNQSTGISDATRANVAPRVENDAPGVRGFQAPGRSVFANELAGGIVHRSTAQGELA